MYRFHVKAVVCAVAALMLAVVHTANAETVFSLTGEGGSDSSYVFTEDGIVLTITADAHDSADNLVSADVHQNTDGLGVENDGDLSQEVLGDSTSLDGSGLIDTLWLHFDRTVTLQSAAFSEVPSLFEMIIFGTGPDVANFSDGAGNDLGSVDLIGDLFGPLSSVDFSDAGLTLTGQTFGISPNAGGGFGDFDIATFTLPGQDPGDLSTSSLDSFRLNELTVSTPVSAPTPTAAGAGLVLLGGLLLRRRRRLA